MESTQVVEVESNFSNCDPSEIGVSDLLLSAISPKNQAEQEEEERSYASIKRSIAKDGFRESSFIHVCRKNYVVVDGHRRRKAAIELGVQEVPIYFCDFADEYEAFVYAVEQQTSRRNIPLDKERQLDLVEKVDEGRKRPRGGVRGNQYYSISGKGSREPLPEPAKTAEETARIVGISVSQVKRCRLVISDTEAYQKVQNENWSIKKAAEFVRAKRKKANRLSKPTTGEQTKDLAPPSQTEEDSPFESEPEKEKPSEHPVANQLDDTTNTPEQSTEELPETPQTEEQAIDSDSDDAVTEEEPRREDEPPSTSRAPEEPPMSPRGADEIVYKWIRSRRESFKQELASMVGPPNLARIPPLYRKVWDLCHTVDPKEWVNCKSCQGKGTKETKGICPACSGAGYSIPKIR